MSYSTTKPIWSNYINNSVEIFITLLKSFFIVTLLTIATTVSIILRIILLPATKWFYININTRCLLRPLSRSLLFVAGVKIKRTNEVEISNAIIVSNRWGYLDSLILTALSPCIVISNVDVKQMPFIGKIMMLMGFVFVDRKNNRSIPIALNTASSILKHTNINVAFFPEGGTGDGFNLKKFKSSFFDLVFAAKRNVVPVAIQIESINKALPDRENINQLVFHNSQKNLYSHILNLLKLKSIGITFTVLSRISYDEIYSKYLSRKKICEIAEKEISNFLNKNKRY